MFNNKSRKILFEKINRLSCTEHEEILKIIKKYDTDYTQNKNGIFFNISTVKNEVIEELNNFLDYSINNSKELDEYDKKLNECKITQKLVQNNNAMYSTNQAIKIKESPDDEWNFLASIETKKMQNIMNFVDKMNLDRDKIGKKKANVKFYNAQKKYMKKSICEKKIDLNEELESEL